MQFNYTITGTLEVPDDSEISIANPGTISTPDGHQVVLEPNIVVTSPTGASVFTASKLSITLDAHSVTLEDAALLVDPKPVLWVTPTPDEFIALLQDARQSDEALVFVMVLEQNKESRMLLANDATTDPLYSDEALAAIRDQYAAIADALDKFTEAEFSIIELGIAFSGKEYSINFIYLDPNGRKFTNRYMNDPNTPDIFPHAFLYDLQMIPQRFVAQQ